MSKTQAPPSSTHPAPSVSIFLTNLHLLDLDRRNDWPSVSLQTFSGKNTLQNERNRIQCVEWALYCLFEIWDVEETKDKLQPFFPPLVPLQSLNLRAALFRCLTDLKKKEVLGKEIIIRKTTFDDCKGEKLQELLASFSTAVLRKVLADGHDGQASIAGRLAIAKRVTSKQHESFLPLAVAHRASLTALLQRKKNLRARYQGFGKVLNLKERELDERFETIVHTQGFLDANVIPDHMVSRVSKLFEKHWQGNEGLVDVFAQGEEKGLTDDLLDKPFSETWPRISDGTSDVPTGVSRHGHLEDLEKRVAEQESRLNQWKEFREAMKKDIKHTADSKVQSPTLTRTKSNNADFQKQRDLVFSPRKSPRKSTWEIEEIEPEKSPTAAMPTTVNGYRNVSISDIKESKYTVNDGAIDIDIKRRGERSSFSITPHGSAKDDSDQSEFSEISSGKLHYAETSQDSRHFKESSGFSSSEVNCASAPQDVTDYIDARVNGPDGPSRSAMLSARISGTALPNDRDSMQHLPGEEMAGVKVQFKDFDEDDLLADQIVSMTLNAAPTPAKPKLSLAERTRQSIMASASPGGLQRLTNDEMQTPPSLPPIADKIEPPSAHASGPTTLAERTRQSILLLPPKPRVSRRSMLDRRTSKVYPTKQFETPKKQMSKIKELTPPEELFSPGAGYDSVFKSRPKVGFSPVASPVPDDSMGFDDGGGDGSVDGSPENSQWEESPLTRVTAKV